MYIFKNPSPPTAPRIYINIVEPVFETRQTKAKLNGREYAQITKTRNITAAKLKGISLPT